MAKIFRKSTALRRKYNLFYYLTLLSGILFATGLLTLASTLIFAEYIAPRLVIGFILIILGISLVSFFGKSANSVYIGLKGEILTAKIVEKLPDGFFGIQNAVVSFEEKQSEIDLIVVGPSGVFIIESKSRNGQIVGDYDAKYWTQHKIGRGGAHYSSDFYSPIKQVGTHIYRLAHFLRSKGLQVTVEGAVFMSSDDSKISLSGTIGRIPVFKNSPDGMKSLLRFITAGKEKLSKKEISYICNLILSN